MRASIFILPAIFIFAPYSNAFPYKSNSILSRGESSADVAAVEAAADTGLEPDSTFAEEAQSTRNPTSPPTSLPTGPPPSFPTGLPPFPQFLPAPQSDQKRKEELKRRAEKVKAAFLHSWEPYQEFGLPDDELRPASREPYSTR
jgi:hypothetical protein